MLKKIDVVSLFPDMFEALNYGITGRALKHQLLTIDYVNPRDYTSDKHRTVDDRPYGGGPGMLMKYEPVKLAINEAKSRYGQTLSVNNNELINGELSVEQELIVEQNEELSDSGDNDGLKRQGNQIPASPVTQKVIYLSPQGRRINQAEIKQLSETNHLIMLCGRYEGIDERIVDCCIDEEWSIGDYVLSGGELPAMVLIDALVRLIPGALGHDESASNDSFYSGLLDHPHYTRPERIDGREVPAVLLSGDHQAIQDWRLQQSLMRTIERRPDLLEQLELNDEQKKLLAKIKRC